MSSSPGLGTWGYPLHCVRRPWATSPCPIPRPATEALGGGIRPLAGPFSCPARPGSTDPNPSNIKAYVDDFEANLYFTPALQAMGAAGPALKGLTTGPYNP